MRQFYLLISFSLLSLACNSQIEQSSIADRLVSAEAFQVIDNHTDFEKQVARADTSRGIKSLMVLKNDTIIFEKYFNGHSRSENYHVRSVTKSFISLLTGIAVDKGLIKNLDESIAPYLSKYAERKNRKALEAITIRHLLTMSTGYEWSEGSASGYIDWDRSGDRIGYVLKRAIVEEPGAKFNYNSGTAHLMSVILEKKIGQPIMSFADENLFNPLGIDLTNVDYQKDKRGFVNGGAGLQLRARDMAKIGLLALHRGKYNGKQIISQNWFDDSLSPLMTFDGPEAPDENSIFTKGYGNLWWLINLGRHQGALAWGWGGQFILVVPKLNTVIITQNDWWVDDPINRRQFLSTFRIMRDILKTLDSNN